MIDDLQLHNLVLKQPQRPARTSGGRRRTGQRNQFGFLLTVKNARHRRRRTLLAADSGIKPLVHVLLSYPPAQILADPQRFGYLHVVPRRPFFTGIRV